MPNVATNGSSRCVEQYVGSLAQAFPGVEAAAWEEVRRGMHADLRPQRQWPAHNETSVVLGIGPGSMGTRSLFAAMTFLNITAAHFGLRYHECAMSHRHMPLAKEPFLREIEAARSGEWRDAPTTFWSDSPVSWLWPAVLGKLPSSERAKVVMTDLGGGNASSVWLGKRLALRGDYCQTTRQDCLVPLAFAAASKHLQANLSLHAATPEQVDSAFAAFSSFVRCVIPPSQLLWLDYADHTANHFAELLAFLELDPAAATAPDGSRFVDGAFPRWGSRGRCTWGDNQDCCAARCERPREDPAASSTCRRALSSTKR